MLWTAVREGRGVCLCVCVGCVWVRQVSPCQRLAVLIVLNLQDHLKTRTFMHTVTPSSGGSRQPHLSAFRHSPSARRHPDRKLVPGRAKGNGNSTCHFFSFLPSKQQKHKPHDVPKASSPPSLPFMYMNMAALSHKYTCHGKQTV